MKTTNTTTKVQAQPENASETYKQLKSALLHLERADYERVRQEIIADIGYDNFRALQNRIFREIGTIKFEERPLKIWQTTINGQNVTVSVWPDRKVRTGYYEKDFWTTLKREGLSLTDEEWTESPGPDWKEIS